MTSALFSDLHPDACGLKLYRITPNEHLLACETVIFRDGRPAVDTVLRRAKLSGRVEIEGEIENHYADVIIDPDGTWDQTIALDAKSYRALKNGWMRCKLETSLQ